MALYDREIAQLEQQLIVLKKQRDALSKVIAITYDPIVRQALIDERADLITTIDEVEQAIDMLKHKRHGSPNGYDKHADEIDWTDPNNWPDIRTIFGFGEGEEPSN